MKVFHRAGAPILLAVLATLPHPARADGASKCKFNEMGSLPVVMDGFSPTIPVMINGKQTRFGLSSGAFFNEMSRAKAAELGLATEPLPSGFMVTGNGGSFTPELARVRDFQLAGTKLQNVEFVVGGNDHGNGYLGANLLGVWDTEFDFAKGTVKFFKASGCNRVNLAYWGKGMSIGEARLLPGQSEQDHHIYVEVIVNGNALRAVLTTDYPTRIGSRAAARLGIDLNAAQVVASGPVSGIETKKLQTWIVHSATVSVGGEEIRNTPITVIDDRRDNLGWDMSLGSDFLMAHHVLVSPTQRKMFLTYNGGPIFSVGTERQLGRIETRAENMGAPEKMVDPKTADEFAGRGSGRLTRNDVIGAIADFSEAIRQAPTRADFLTDRANAYFRGGHPELAAKDIDAALVITPTDHRLLIRRAQIRLGKGDKAGALADTDAAAAATPKGSLDIGPVVTLYERLGLADRGLALLDPLLELHRDDISYASLLNKRSWNRALANAELDRALRDINNALRKSDNDPTMLDTRALVQLRRKDFAAAIGDAGAALDKMPKLATSLFIRGLARIAIGDEAGGKADIDAARASQATIDQRFADYGLIAPKPDAVIPARPSKPGGG